MGDFVKSPVHTSESNPWLLAYSVVLAALLSGQAWCQSQAQQQSDEYDEFEPILEEVIVTGTRIKRVDLEVAAPLTVIDSELIENSGYTSVSELLRASVYNSFGSWRATGFEASGFGGAAFVNLRGLGSENTLVLLNGRRLAPFPGAGAEGQDINQIPVDMVERIEILRDGASAIYGSDAIAGVVNIITRKDMRNVIATLQVEGAEPEGGEAGRLSLTGGYGSERGNLTFSVEHFRQEEIYTRDIPREANPTLYRALTQSGFPGSAYVLNGPLRNLLLVDPRCPGNLGESEAFPNAYRWNWFEFEPGTDWLFSAFCGYNQFADSTRHPEIERNGLYVDGYFDLSYHTRFVGRALLSRTKTIGARAPTPLEDYGMTYSADNPNNPLWLYIGQTVTDTGLTAAGVPGGTWTFTEDDLADVWVLMRTVPLGPREAASEHENRTLFAGLEGETPWFGGTQWDIGLEFASSQVKDTYRNSVNLQAMQEVMDSGELDLFNVQGQDHDAWLAETNAAFAKANDTLYYIGETDLWTVDGKLSFDAFQWENSPVPVVVGFEYQDLAYHQGYPAPQDGIAGGDYVGELIESASRDIATFYAETALPLGSQVQLGLAVRFDNYSDFGSTTNPKLSLAWRPGRNWLLRGTWGTGFKAPSMIELFAPRQEAIRDAVDYVGCENGVAPCNTWHYTVVLGGNPNLDAHESESWTAGLVWNPTDRLDLELTYYDIEYTNKIEEIGLQAMFRRERDGLWHTVVRKPDGTVDYVDTVLINVSGQRTNGIDFNANYTLNTERVGRFDFRLALSRPLSDERAVLDGEGYDDYLDRYGEPELRANFMLDWAMGAFQATWVTHYIDDHGKGENLCWPGLSEPPCEEGTELFYFEEYWWHDLQLAWNTRWNGQIALGARNLFNEEPPYHECCISTAWDLYAPGYRTIYLRYRQEFH